jgi:arylsulfatase A-like enzyme
VRRRSFLIGAAAASAAAIGAGAYVYDRRDPDESVRRYGSTVITRRRPDPDAPDVLFVSLDDCNDWVGFLRNHPGTHTPNLDALAAESVVFSQAYCTAPMCRPARMSVMFGKAPYEVGVYDHSDQSNARLLELGRTHASLVDDFWGAGYDVVVAGKVFGDFPRGRFTQSRPTRIEPADPDWISPYDGRPLRGGGPRGPLDFGPSGDQPDEGPDGEAATWVRQQLLAPRSRPLFLAYGLVSTHVAWRVPQKYFDLHPVDGVVLPEYRPDDLDDLGPTARELIDDRTVEQLRRTGRWQAAVQAYQAAMSYADDRLGVVLDALASKPAGNDTVVVVWSDHGFHLGEKLHWHKFTLWEQATRIPMVFRLPGRSGDRVDRPVSAMDIGPTLLDFTGVPSTEAQSGASLLPALDDPALVDQRPPISTWLPGNHAVRQGPWRYIRYRDDSSELYDHRTDPDEQTNLAGRPEYLTIERALASYLPEPSEEVDWDRTTAESSNAETSSADSSND